MVITITVLLVEIRCLIMVLWEIQIPATLLVLIYQTIRKTELFDMRKIRKMESFHMGIWSCSLITLLFLENRAPSQFRGAASLSATKHYVHMLETFSHHLKVKMLPFKHAVGH